LSRETRVLSRETRVLSLEARVLSGERASAIGLRFGWGGMRGVRTALARVDGCAFAVVARWMSADVVR
jgi:hypothetical protein